jgi:HTH domain.
MPRGRQPLFSQEQVTYIRDNPDQLSYSELAQKFACSVQTIKRVVKGRNYYADKD